MKGKKLSRRKRTTLKETIIIVMQSYLIL